jgi:aldose 1-epimerase
MAIQIKKELWGTADGGKEIYKYTMTNASGASVVLGSVGAAIVGINVPDRDGKLADVVIGYPDAASYFGDGPCAGKIPGRFANRIAAGKFTLDGKEYTLPINNGPNHLHGGPEGFQNQVWDSRIEGEAVEFMYFSQDGEAGYPGNLKVVAHYQWSEDNELELTMTAETDAPTVVNLTNHVYFNLNGEGAGDIKDHVLKLNASEYLPTDDTLIPTGESEPVAGTPMDFITEKAIGAEIDADFTALNYGKGYDNCFLIDGWQSGQLQDAAELYAPASGRKVSIVTSQPGIQIYTGNWLEGCPAGKNGHTYHDYWGVALECSHYPDSPNEPDYPPVVLRPGEVYKEAIIWAFSVKE